MVLGNCGWDGTMELWGRDLESFRVGLGRCTQCRMVLGSAEILELRVGNEEQIGWDWETVAL